MRGGSAEHKGPGEGVDCLVRRREPRMGQDIGDANGLLGLLRGKKNHAYRSAMAAMISGG